MSSRLTVVVGGGGVGKTTTSAAFALSRARQGQRTLVVTVDPARRLADALGVSVGIHASPVDIDGTTFHARMPDARKSVDLFARWLFDGAPEQRDRVLANRMYQELRDSVAGIHELICVAFIEHELQSNAWDEVVLDTAPSRHALEFLDYPGKLARMLDGKAMEWVAQLADVAGIALEERPKGNRLFEWGKKRVGSLIGNIVGLEALGSIAELFLALASRRDRWLELVRQVEWRLKQPSTRYLIVTAVHGSALDDAEFLDQELRERGLEPSGVLLNRAQDEVPDWLEQLHGAATDSGPLASAVEANLKVAQARQLQTQRARTRLGNGAAQNSFMMVLPRVESIEPRLILQELAEPLGGVV